jgi:predicted amidohydrolase YtcJ
VLYRGGTILTMSEAAPTAEAIAVKDGIITAVGPEAVVRDYCDRFTQIVDLKGRALLPGFFDPHGHLMLVGLQALSANLLPPPDGDGTAVTALVRRLSDWSRAHPNLVARTGLILGFGYDDSQLAERRHPNRHDLDRVSRERPVVAIHQSGHLGAANSRALELAGISASTPDPEGGRIQREPGGSEPNGVLEENAFLRLTAKLTEAFDEQIRLEMIQAGSRFYASFGYTTAQEARAFSGVVKDLERAAELGLLEIDVLVYPDLLEAKSSIHPSSAYRRHLRIGGAKLSLDGSPQGKTAWLTEPYYEPPPGRSRDYRGYPAIDPARVPALVKEAFRNGWQLLAHANGDAAADVLIRAVRQARNQLGPSDRRPVLIHGQVLRADQLDRCKELGIFVSLFPMHTFYWGDWHESSVLGPVRAPNISPTGWALARGVPFTTHHDAPVANPDSMRVLSATVTRRTRTGRVLGPSQCVSVEVALKAMTIWAARQHFEEWTKGSLEVGKVADLVILSDDPRKVDPRHLSELKVIETIKSGRTVYRRRASERRLRRTRERELRV